MADRGHHMSLAAVIALLSVVAAGCSTKQQGQALATSVSTADRYGAPRVSAPLDASAFLTRPCAVLTAAQLAGLDLPDPGVPDTTSDVTKYAGPSCSWKNSPKGIYTAVSFTTSNRNGLADIYRGHAGGQFKGYWIETTVDGYPAVYRGDQDTRKNGGCLLNVGLSDTLEALFDQQDRTGEKSCEKVKLVASMVLATVRAGG